MVANSVVIANACAVILFIYAEENVELLEFRIPVFGADWSVFDIVLRADWSIQHIMEVARFTLW
jgi:hypothetical protein